MIAAPAWSRASGSAQLSCAAHLPVAVSNDDTVFALLSPPARYTVLPQTPTAALPRGDGIAASAVHALVPGSYLNDLPDGVQLASPGIPPSTYTAPSRAATLGWW